MSTADIQVAFLIKIHLASKMPLMKIMFNIRNKDDKDRLVMPIPLDRDQSYHAWGSLGKPHVGILGVQLEFCRKEGGLKRYLAECRLNMQYPCVGLPSCSFPD